MPTSTGSSRKSARPSSPVSNEVRLVVDTNVIVSAALKDSSSPATVLRWISAYGGLLKSSITEREVVTVLRRPRIASKITPRFLANVERLLASAEPVNITERIVACRDPKDDKFLELAWNGRADMIISGDQDLLVLGIFRGIPIVPPAAFVSARPRHSAR